MEPTTRQQAEQETIRRILGGDTAHFATLVDRYRRPVYALVLRIAGDSAEAEELAQDCFLKAYKALGSFRGTCAFSTWLFRIAYNTAVSAARRSRRELRGVDERRLASVSDEEADALFASGNEEKIGALVRAIAALTAEERALLHLFYYDAQPVGACAGILGLSEVNVKVRLHRIRRKLYLLMVETNGTEYEK